MLLLNAGEDSDSAGTYSSRSTILYKAGQELDVRASGHRNSANLGALSTAASMRRFQSPYILHTLRYLRNSKTVWRLMEAHSTAGALNLESSVTIANM